MPTKKRKAFKLNIAGKLIAVGPNTIPHTKGGTPEQQKEALRKLAKLNLFKIDEDGTVHPRY